jgi:hypothetical protein
MYLEKKMLNNFKKIGLFVISTWLIACYNQECNCKNFKTGKFAFVQEINGVKQTTIFERTDKFQIETYNGKTDTATVRWVNNCEFVLQKIKPRNSMEQKAISMRILSTTDKGYQFEYSYVGSDKKQIGFVTKL